MIIRFTKMHGAGNDYIYINCMEGIPFDPADLARKMSPRHFSVGGDGIVLICTSDNADAKMRMFNADGSEGKMCGNAIRCVGKYLYERGIVKKEKIDIETLSGVKHLTLHIEGETVKSVSVDMGRAILDGEKIPTTLKGLIREEPITVMKRKWHFTAVSMGNPHAVVFVDDPDALDLPAIGPSFEHHPYFPEQVNTEFASVLDATHIRMRVWERGSGETYACGTGACATVVAAAICGYVAFDTPIEVSLIGGTLTITVSSDLTVTMEGPAETVYEGEYTYACETE